MEKNENLYEIYNKNSNWVSIDETPNSPSPVYFL